MIQNMLPRTQSAFYMTATAYVLPIIQNPGHLRHQQLPPDQRAQNPQTQLRKKPHKAHRPPLPLLLLRIHIPKRIHQPKNVPRNAHCARQQRVLQAPHQQRRQHRGLVLRVVGVRALGAVEEVGGLRAGGFRGRGVRVRVLDAGRFAVAAGPDAVPDGEGGGRCCREDDVAGKGEDLVREDVG